MESTKHRMIESLAYYIYLTEGRPEGRAWQHWLEAEELIGVEEQFEAESWSESNLSDDKALEEPELASLAH